MTFNWFTRGNDESPNPDPTPSPQPASESTDISQSNDGDGTDVTGGSDVPSTPPAPEATPATPEDEALAWAREAYARLKAQQEQAKRMARSSFAKMPAAAQGTMEQSAPAPRASTVPLPPALPAEVDLASRSHQTYG